MRARRMIAAVLLLAVLPACEMTVRLDTVLRGDGSGTFTLGLDLDRKAFEQMRVLRTAQGSSVERLDALFVRLGTSGWRIERSEPNGGLRMRASRDFDDAAGFDRVLRELRGGEGGGLEGVRLAIGVSRTQSFFRTTSTFGGEAALSALNLDEIPNLTDEARAQLEAALREAFTLEVRVQLPADVAAATGEPVVKDNTATWTPALGSTLTFSARSSGLRPGGILLVAGPAIGLLLVVGAAALGARRRRRSRAADDAPRVLVLEETDDVEVRRRAAVAAARAERRERDEREDEGPAREPD